MLYSKMFIGRFNTRFFDSYNSQELFLIVIRSKRNQKKGGGDFDDLGFMFWLTCHSTFVVPSVRIVDQFKAEIDKVIKRRESGR